MARCKDGQHTNDVVTIDPTDDRAGVKYVCTRKGCGYSSFQNCTIKRSRVVTSGITLDMRTGETDYTKAVESVFTEACGVPLFGGDGSVRGVCRSCASGFEVDGNRFANEAERARAARDTEGK